MLIVGQCEQYDPEEQHSPHLGICTAIIFILAVGKSVNLLLHLKRLSTSELRGACLCSHNLIIQ